MSDSGDASVVAIDDFDRGDGTTETGWTTQSGAWGITPKAPLTVWAVGENDHGGMTYCLHATEEAARACLQRTRMHAGDDVWPVEVWPGVEHG